MNRKFTAVAFVVSVGLLIPQLGGRVARAEFLYDCSLDQHHAPAIGPLGTHRRKGLDDTFGEHAFDGRFFGDSGRSDSAGGSNHDYGFSARFGAGSFRHRGFSSGGRNLGGNNPWRNGIRANHIGSRNGHHRDDDHSLPNLNSIRGHIEREHSDTHRVGNQSPDFFWNGPRTRNNEFCFGDHSTHDLSDRQQGESSAPGHASFDWIRQFPHGGSFPSDYSEFCGDRSRGCEHPSAKGVRYGDNPSVDCDHFVWCRTPRHRNYTHCGGYGGGSRPGTEGGGTGGNGGSNGNPNGGSGNPGGGGSNGGGGGGWIDTPPGGGDPDPGDPTGTFGDPDPGSITHAPVPSSLVLSLSSLGFAGLFRTVRERFSR